MGWDKNNFWSYAQTSLLWELTKTDLSLTDISSRIGKTPEQIRAKAAELGITLFFDSPSEKVHAEQKGA